MNTLKIKKLASAAMAVGLFAFGAGPAKAIVIGLADAPVAFAFSKVTGTAAGTVGLSGTLDITALTAHSATVAITLNNLSTDASDRLTAFGFGIDPNVTAVAFSDAADGGMIHASLDNIPNLANIEVCAFGGPNNCNGGGNGGILFGGSDSFVLTLTGTFGSQITFDPLGAKFQTVADSFEFGCSGATCSPPVVCTGPDCGGGGGAGDPLPEPASLALFGLGLLGLGMTYRRKS